MTTSRQRLSIASKRLKTAFQNHRLKSRAHRNDVIRSQGNKPCHRHTHDVLKTIESGEPYDNKTAQSALVNIALPAIHPFLWAQKDIKYKVNKRRGRWSEKMSEEAYRIELLVPSTPTAIHTTKELKSYDRSTESTSTLRSARTIAANLYARYHYIYADAMERFVVPEKVLENSGEKKVLMRNIIDTADQYQTAIMKFYETGVQKAVEEMGGLEIWQLATKNERIHTFARLFNQYPLDVATASLGPVAFAVPLRHIFSDTTPLHKKWQKFHRTVFQLACEDTFELRVATQYPQKKRTYAKWKGMTESEMIKKLDLGDEMDIPADWTASLLLRRQPNRIELGSEPTFSDMENI